MAAGGSGAGEDEAQLLNSSWGRTRTNVHGAGLDAFHFRQYLFACQARLLLALQRPVEVWLLLQLSLNLKPQTFRPSGQGQPACLRHQFHV